MTRDMFYMSSRTQDTFYFNARISNHINKEITRQFKQPLTHKSRTKISEIRNRFFVICFLSKISGKVARLLPCVDISIKA